MLWLLPIGVLAVASASILIRLTPADPVAIAFWRLALATLIAAPFAAARGLPRGRELAYSIASGVLLAVHFLSWIPSLFLTTVAASTTLVNIHPVVMLLLTKALRERVGKRAVAGVLVATAGALLTTFAPGGLLGNALAILGAVSFAGYIALGRVVRSAVNTWGYVAVAYGSAAAVSLLAGVALGSNFFNYSWQVFAMFLLIASIPMMAGHTVFNYLLGRYRAITVATSVLGEPVGATLLAALLLGETPAGYVETPVGALPLQAVGIIITLVGILLVVREELIFSLPRSSPSN